MCNILIRFLIFRRHFGLRKGAVGKPGRQSVKFILWQLLISATNLMELQPVVSKSRGTGTLQHPQCAQSPIPSNITAKFQGCIRLKPLPERRMDEWNNVLLQLHLEGKRLVKIVQYVTAIVSDELLQLPAVQESNILLASFDFLWAVLFFKKIRNHTLQCHLKGPKS